MRYLGVDIPDDDYEWLENRKWSERTTLADQVREAISDYRKLHPVATIIVTVPLAAAMSTIDVVQPAQAGE